MLLDRENVLTQKIIGCCFKAHNILGPGFDESTYHNALIQIFKIENINYETQKTIPVYLEDVKIGTKRLDLLVENKIIVELKSIKGSLPIIFRQQLVSYLRATKLQVGLLVNFGNQRCTINRFLNDTDITG